MRAEFGIFEPVFETAHGYLALLGLHADDAAESVARVRSCCRSTSDPCPDICRLLADKNWRPHLVAAVAVLVSGYQEEVVRQLWRRIDTGSWVSPQLAATLFLVDPAFLEQARSRLEACCPLDAGELLSISPIERHSAAGPGGSVERSAKAAHSLLRLVEFSAPAQPWINNLRNSSEMQTLLARDVDGAAIIAEEWLNSIRAITGLP